LAAERGEGREKSASSTRDKKCTKRFSHLESIKVIIIFNFQF
jgi:hypothetical protein